MPNSPDNYLVELHRDLALANGQLSEMKATMVEILKAMGEFRLSIEGLKAWQAAMTVESRVDKNEIETLREELTEVKAKLQTVQQGYKDIEARVQTLRWVWSAASAVVGIVCSVVGFLYANRGIFLK